MILPVSAIIPTRDRARVLSKTLDSLLAQSDIPGEVVIIDASERNHDALFRPRLESAGIKFIYAKAKERGAATQRVEGIVVSSQPYVLLMDDDILFEEDCIRKMWNGFSTDELVGAVNALITNQKYTRPGLVTRMMYCLMSGEVKPTFAGRLIGPAWNLLPEDREELPEYLACEWLNTTCTLYRRSALPQPVFDPHFKGYSLMEDVALSVRISRSWKLLNARVARIYHDSQPGDHKSDLRHLSAMEFVNRYYIMTSVLGRTGLSNNIKFAIFELFQLVTGLAGHRSLRLLLKDISGKWSGLRRILS
jgi:glycosyltransferase involved in cell wall biosynthesis